MSKKKDRFAQIGIIKRSTNDIVDEALKQQEEWLKQKRKTGAATLTPAVPKPQEDENMKEIKEVKAETKTAGVAAVGSAARNDKKTTSLKIEGRPNILKAYWFPILCAVAIVLMLVYLLFASSCSKKPDAQIVPEPTVQPVAAESVTPAVVVVDPEAPAGDKSQNIDVVEEAMVPSFDVVRISKEGQLTIGGRFLPMQSVSIVINNKIVATELTTERGEFAYTPSKEFEPGNYTIRLIGVDQNVKSTQDVFVYIAPRDEGSSLSLLMTKDGSRLLQVPSMVSGDLSVSKIDYLANGRIFVQGKALPRLRVTMALDGRELGMSRVSDHKNFGLGANVEPLTPGQEYKLSVKLHDGEGNIAASFDHVFNMPTIMPGDDTYYTVRSGDALWIISRNFFGRGSMFTLIVEKNNIKNADLIFPEQRLQIPISEK